jgi:chromosomal replication initiation ATPase DnaA
LQCVIAGQFEPDSVVASQIPLPLDSAPSLSRADFIVGNGNLDALAFVESWPAWAVPAAALYGPAASGKSHLVAIWAARSRAQCVAAAALSGSAFVLLDRAYPVVIEDVDTSLRNPARDRAIFELLESATPATAVLLTGRAEPSSWSFTLPDLGSRFSSLVAFSLWAPDDDLLRKLAQKLFEDRQLVVPEPTIDQILRSLERSPAAIREFVARADAKALAQGRSINSALVRELLAESPSSG